MISVLTRGPVLSVGGREKGLVPVRAGKWAVGSFLFWAEWFPGALFIFFSFFSSFSFSVFPIPL
jgi:hypothetical protein